jgi:hypothetical protein
VYIVDRECQKNGRKGDSHTVGLTCQSWCTSKSQGVLRFDGLSMYGTRRNYIARYCIGLQSADALFRLKEDWAGSEPESSP